MVQQPKEDGIFFDLEQRSAVAADIQYFSKGGAVLSEIVPGFARVAAAPELTSAYRVMPFVQQIVPGLIQLEFPSITKAADEVVRHLVRQGVAEPWQLLTIGFGCHRRAVLIAEAVSERIRKEPQLRRNFRPSPDAEASVAQLILTAPEQGFLSWVPREIGAAYGSALVPYTGGLIPVEPNQDAPARAFQKLVEAQARFSVAFLPGQQVVDLGASPGGWTYVALHQGAKIIAIDRSPLRDDLMGDSRVSWIKGDVFSYQPPGAVDHLICDVIAVPEKSLELLERWLAAGWCRNFILTLKFKGEPASAVIRRAQEIVLKTCGSGGLQRLGSNKNEITVSGKLK